MRFGFKKEERAPSIFDLSRFPLNPAPLFRLKFSLRRFEGFPLGKGHCLPDLSWLNQSPTHCSFYVGWSLDGLGFEVHYSKEEFYCLPTSFREGDAVELFIDTRDNKEANYPTRFCHHFLCYPEKVEGFFGKEMTRFRGDNTHDLANPRDLVVKKRGGGRGVVLEIFIPKECLTGYDPDQFKRLGLTYRCHERGARPQLFSTSPQFSIEQNPSFFASFNLMIEAK